jgi:membrane-bound acyltransferase YfiQ involved in biofilm formation
VKSALAPGDRAITHWVMSEEDPVIDLVPKNPFSWKIVVLFIVAWVVVFALVVQLKSGTIRLLLPLIGVIFLIYLVVCTLYYLKNRK